MSPVVGETGALSGLWWIYVIMYSVKYSDQSQAVSNSQLVASLMSTETISVTDLRPRISELVDRAHREFERFVITRQGRAEAVLMAADELDGLLETIEILSDRTLVKKLVEAEEELAAGGGHALDDIRAALAEHGDG